MSGLSGGVGGRVSGGLRERVSGGLRGRVSGGLRARWLLTLLSLVTFLLLALPAPALAEADFLPEQPQGMVTWSKPPLYDRYSVWHYTYGYRSPGTEVVRLFYTMNLAQVGKAWLVRLTIRVVEHAVFLDVATPMIQKVSTGMTALVDSLWQRDRGVLVVTGLLVAGALALWYGTVAGRRGQAWRQLAGTAAILIGSYAFFAMAPQTLHAGASLARGLGRQVLSGIALVGAPAGGEGTPDERLLRASGEAVWDVFVHQPWIEGEFTADGADRPQFKDDVAPGGRWLDESPTRRQTLYQMTDATTRYRYLAQWDENYVLDYLPRRVTLAAASGLIALAYAIGVLLLAGGIFYYQLLLLVIFALSPVLLLLALWHPAGLRLARGALVKALGALLAQVVLMAVLGLLLLLTPALAAVSEPLGWSGQALLLALLAVALFRYRFRWLSLGTEGQRRESGEEEAQPALRQRMASVMARTLLRPVRLTQRQAAVSAAAAEPMPLAPPGGLPTFRQESDQPERAVAERTEPDGSAMRELTAELQRLRLRFGRSEEAPLPDRLTARTTVKSGESAAAASAGGATATKPQRPEDLTRLRSYGKR